MLIETHSLKPYRQRVLGTCVLIEESLRLVGAEMIVGEIAGLDEEGLRNAPAQIAQRVDKELVSR